MSGSATVQQWADAVRRFGEEWPPVGGKAAAGPVRDRVRADTGGDNKFSRMKRGGRTAVRVVPVDASTVDVVAAGNIGLWHILEKGTKPHRVQGKRRGRGKKAKRGLLATPYGPRPYVDVRGVAARRTWTESVVQGMAAAQESADRAWARVTR